VAYENKVEFRNGQIVLYTRNDSPIFHVRLKVEGRDGYVVKSTKRASLDEARAFAENLLDDLRYKVRHGQDTGSHTFDSVWKRWLESNRRLLSEHRLRYVEGTARRYLLPFFGKMAIETITDVTINRYWDWRVNYWSSAEGTAKIEAARKTRTTKLKPFKNFLGNVAKVPAHKSLDMEKTVIRQVLGWGERNGLVQRVPDVKAPKARPGAATNRRPAFDLDEWRTLYRFMRTWVAEDYVPAEEIDGVTSPSRKPNGHHRWHRELLRSYVLFLGSSGIRPNEARQLRWRDISRFEDDHGIQQVVLYIAPSTKTGERECIPLRNAWVILERIRKTSAFTKPTDLVFGDREGNPIDNFGKTFKSLLIRCNLLEDRFGRTRTVYSLRHSYCTFRLSYGNVTIEDLAQNMGTSPATIFNHYRHITTRQKAHVLVNCQSDRSHMMFQARG
jgi:integrase